MSYDIELRANATTCPTCGHQPDVDVYGLPDPTYNLAQIFDRALRSDPPSDDGERAHDLRILNGRKAGDTVPRIRGAIERLSDPAQAAAFRQLEPSNRWGTLEDARKVMGWLLDAAEKHPNHVWEIR